jgi:spermidine synthase
MKPERMTVLAGVSVGLIAFCTLFFEVILTRIFAVTLWYHFGFLVISLALLGIAAAGIFCYLYPERLAGEHHLQYMSKFALLFAIIVPIAVALHIFFKVPEYGNAIHFYLILSLQLLFLFLAFFFSGMCISIALFHYSKKIGTIYFFDLIGASLGSLLVVPFMYRLSALSLIFIISCIACFVSWLLKGIHTTSWLKHSKLILAFLFLIVTLMNDSLGLLKVTFVKSYSSGNIQIEENNKDFVKWSPVSRVAVFEPKLSGNVEHMKVTNDAGAPTSLYRFDGNFIPPIRNFIKKDIRQIAHKLKSNADVLVIGSAGGLDVLSALFHKQKQITAVEINPVIGELVTKYYTDYIGHIFEHPRVKLYIQEGRNFTAGSRSKYDIIQITMVDSWGGAAAGAYIFNENSLYTYEAIHDFFTHLNPGGFLSITRYYQWDEALRLVNTMIQYLLNKGVEDVHNRIMVLIEHPKKSRRATVLLKNNSITSEDIAVVLKSIPETNASVVYAPSIPEKLLEKGDYANQFRFLINPDAYNVDRQKIIQSYPKNITPSTDDKPFFFFMQYLRDIFRIDKTEHAARRIAMPLLYGMVSFFTLLGILTIFLPLYLKSGSEILQARYRTRSLIYFAMLGCGYMLIEISLIQRLTIFLGHPTWSFVVVLATMLFSSGIGSYMTNKWKGPSSLMVIISCIVLILLFYIFALYDQLINMMALSKPLRILIAVFAISPPAFFMGMCFPLGIQIVRLFNKAFVPWAWGVNGAFSVCASILSIVIALNAGFKSTMLIGVIFYMVAFLIIFSFRNVTLTDRVPRISKS